MLIRRRRPMTRVSNHRLAKDFPVGHIRLNGEVAERLKAAVC
jgi:hypothetical protein